MTLTKLQPRLSCLNPQKISRSKYILAMSQDGRHLNGGLQGILPMMTQYGFKMSDDLETNLKQFTKVGQDNILRYAAWEAKIYKYQKPVNTEICAVYVENKVMWLCNGREVMLQALSPDASPQNVNSMPARRLEPIRDDVDSLCLFILNFLGIDVITNDASQIHQLNANVGALRAALKQQYPQQPFFFSSAKRGL